MGDGSRLAVVTDLLVREATFLDEQRWSDWLSLFDEACEYWVPSWRDDGRLVEDPRREISLFYHSSRAGLEDRVHRITSGMSPASMPLPRTAHAVSNVRLGAPAADDVIRAASTWSTDVYDPKFGESHRFFGRAEYELGRAAGAWLIRKKKTVLLNDRIASTLDIYCI
ncbi:MAG TPA: aromatic-ring-hydroxylating dioxygenase subunit beta [Hyphomicrobiales bacterium]|nr:aromatic-ring-hydroxylating dioxygenase subunit beta [Hyphomicrobiales bacterium]